jgi:hypothetical protein
LGVRVPRPREGGYPRPALDPVDFCLVRTDALLTSAGCEASGAGGEAEGL